MATRKNASKSTATPSTSTPSAARSTRSRKTSSRAGTDSSSRVARTVGRRVNALKYVAPGAAVLATGAIAAAGYVLREHLADVVAIALKTATKGGARAAAVTSKAFEGAADGAMHAADRVSESVSMETLLRYAGLQRRSSTLMSVLSPTVGALCGFAAGSAAMYFFGPKLLDQLKESGIPVPNDERADDAEPTSTSDAKSTTTTSSDAAAPVNGSLHGRMS